jgi:hypothetical protein
MQFWAHTEETWRLEAVVVNSNNCQPPRMHLLCLSLWITCTRYCSLCEFFNILFIWYLALFPILFFFSPPINNRPGVCVLNATGRIR